MVCGDYVGGQVSGIIEQHHSTSDVGREHVLA